MTQIFPARQAQGLRWAGKLGKNQLISNPILMEKIRASFPGGLVKRLIHSYTVVLILSLSACTELPRQAFDKDTARDLRTVVVTDHAKDEYFWVTIVSYSQVFTLNLAGGIFAAADLWAKTARVTTALDPKQTRVQNRSSKRLAEGLNSCGYDAEVITFDEPARLDDALKLASQRSKADAVVAVRVYASYVAASWDSDYIPQVLATVKAFDAKSGKVLYEDAISYGYEAAKLYKTVHSASEAKYRFRSVDDIVKNAELAREGLLAGADAIAAQIAADLDPKRSE